MNRLTLVVQSNGGMWVLVFGLALALGLAFALALGLAFALSPMGGRRELPWGLAGVDIHAQGERMESEGMVGTKV